MSMTLAAICTIAVVVALCIIVIFVQSAEKKPHIVMIIADDLGWNDVGFHGSNEIPTPNIDALAYAGVILQNYYVLPLCSPSRSALLTGLHPINTGMQHGVVNSNEPWGLPLEISLLPQYLKNQGYATHAVGKWHLGYYKAAYTPTKRGFDTHFGYWTGRQGYYDHSMQGTFWGYDMRRGLDVSWESYSKYSTDLFTEEAVNIIKSHKTSTPMFLYLAHLAVHSGNKYDPLEAPDDIIKKFDYIENKERRKFAAMLWKLDESVGKIVSALADKQMLRDSVIIFTTDNGGPAGGFNNNAASNWPLRGVKDTLWEGGVRGSGFIWSPRIDYPGRVMTELMHIQDWTPTILGMVTDSYSPKIKFDGKNLWQAISGNEKNATYNEVLINIDGQRNISALRKGNWKIITGQTWDGKWDGWYGPSGREAKLIYNTTDIYESSVVKALKKSLLPFPDLESITSIRSKSSVNCTQGKLSQDKTEGEDKQYLCNVKDKTCLFNVLDDPCELRNMAVERKDILQDLLESMEKYKPVEPLNKPGDPASNPVYWNYTWTNWMDYYE